MLTSSIARVIGPTPPGTGVIQPATWRDAGEIHVAAELAFVVAVHTDVDDHGTRLDHVGGQHVALADRRDDDVRLPGMLGEVLRSRCDRW